jgi:hypothetical protein
MEKWAYGLLGGTALIALACPAKATVVPISPANTDLPGLANTLNPMIAGIPGIGLSMFFTGVTLPATTVVFNGSQLPRSMVVDQIAASMNVTATCVTAPTVSLVASAVSSFATPVVIAVTPQLTATSGIVYNSGQITAGTIVAAGQYVGFTLTNFSTSTASCTVISVQANVIGH